MVVKNMMDVSPQPQAKMCENHDVRFNSLQPVRFEHVKTGEDIATGTRPFG